MIFHHFRSYSVTLVPSFEPPFPPVPRASVVIHVVKKRFPTKKDGKRFLGVISAIANNQVIGIDVDAEIVNQVPFCPLRRRGFDGEQAVLH